MELKLYHRIGSDGADSAAVRQFLVDHHLTDLVEFSNIAYTNPQQELMQVIGAVEAPVLLARGRAIRGKVAILDWLRTNLLAQRD